MASGADTNVLIVAQGEEEVAAPDLRPEAREEPLFWDDDAEARLSNVPRFARRMARRGVEDYAREHGHSRVALQIYHQARKRFGMGT